MDDELKSHDESNGEVMPFHTIEQLGDCFCGMRIIGIGCSAETIEDVIADPDPEKLQSFLDQGWHHFVQWQRDCKRRLPSLTPELADADASAYWAPIKHRFCAQKQCRFSPNYGFAWFVEYEIPRLWYQSHSALTAAIRKQSEHHVALLLELGANPDGFDLSVYQRFQAEFLRFRPSVDPTMGYEDEGDMGSQDEIPTEIETPETVHITE
jgi:hypothetical protein